MNTISTPDKSRSIQPIDGLISFPPINPSRVITLLHDALVLTLCINSFDVHRVLADPSSAVDLLQLPSFRQMKVPLDKLSSAGIICFGFNGVTTLTMGDIALSVKAGSVTSLILNFQRLGAIQCYLWSGLDARYESSTLNLPSNNQLPNQCWTD